MPRRKPPRPRLVDAMTHDSVSQVTAVLRTVLRLLDVSYRDIERQLGWSPSYLSRLFAGSIELRFQHILGITQALGLRPDEFFRIAFPPSPQPPSEAFAKLQESLAPLQRVSPPSRAEEIELLVLKSLRKLYGQVPPAVGELPHV